MQVQLDSQLLRLKELEQRGHQLRLKQRELQDSSQFRLGQMPAPQGLPLPQLEQELLG